MNLFGSKPRIGLALGSGAARGLAHIGVLKVFEEADITISAIAGTSIGALIGALYAAGMPTRDMEEVAQSTDWRKLARLVDPILPTSGLIDGKRIARFFSELLPVQDFKELRIPLAMTTTDVESGEAIVISSGHLPSALRAAISFPGIFTPVSFGDRFLVDGGLCHPVPADVVRDLGVDRVIGVCAIPPVEKRSGRASLPGRNSPASQPGVIREKIDSARVVRLWGDIFGHKERSSDANGTPGKDRKPPNLFRVFAQSVAIMENQINDLRLAQDRIDLLIRPDFPDFNLFEFQRAEEAIQAGEAKARELLPQIRKLAS